MPTEPDICDMMPSNAAIDLALCCALGMRPGETLLDAADRVSLGPACPAKSAAMVLISNDSGDVWSTMRAAYRALIYDIAALGPIRVVKCLCCQKPAVSAVGDFCAYHGMLERRAARAH
jgi:hypothetical protein